jgi:hypothetical protein
MTITNKDRRLRRRANQVEETVEDQEEEEVVAKPTRVARRVKAEVVPDLDDGEEVDLKAVKSKTRSRPTSRVAKPADNGAEDDTSGDEEPVVAETRMPSTVQIDDLTRLLDYMAKGHTLMLQRYSDDTWEIGMTKEERVASGRKKLTGVSYWDEVLSDEFQTFQKEWSKLSPEEKIAKARKEGVTWDEHDDPKINIMHLSDAYRAHYKIKKYKPEYENAAMRKALKESRS